MEVDYYEILEISKNSDNETIKKAFREQESNKAGVLLFLSCSLKAIHLWL